MIPALTGSGFEAGTGNSPGFRYFLQEITLPPILQAKIASARLKKVEVLVPSCHWRLFLKFSEAVPENEEFWQPLTEALLRHVPSLKGVSYQICYQLSGKNARFLLENFQEAFLQSIQVQAPFLAGWLEASRIEAVDEKLVFWLPSDLGRQFFLAKDARDMIKSILIDKFDWKGEVSLKVDERGDQSFFPGRDYAEKYLAGRLGISGRGNEARSKKKALTGERTLLGKNITQSPTAIIDILDEEKSVSIQGVILSLTSRELKNGRHLFLFDVTDVSDTITVKAFEPEKGWHQLPSLQEGDWILVQGQVQHDPYTRELTLVARNMNRVEPELRLDQAPEKRVELHLHTKMSALDAINNIDMVFKTAALWGHEAVAITDHGVVQAFPEAYEAGKRYGVKPIYGLEGYLFNEEEKKPRLYHVVILVKNQEGLENLYRLVTLSHLDYFYRKPRIPRSELVRLQKGLLLGSACEAGEVIQGYLAGKTHEELLHIADFYDYIEIQPLDNNEFMVRKGLVASLDELKTMNLELVELAKKLGKPVVATGDVHFLNPEDEIFRKVLHAGQGYADEEQAPLYFRTTEEMLAEFAYLGEELAKEVVITGPAQIAATIEEVMPIPEGFYPPEISGAEEQVSSMAWQKALELYGEPLPSIVQDRLEKELESIISNGFAVLYLIAHKLVRKSNQDGYLVGSRGSVGSSLVATLTGITEVNPLPAHYLCHHCRYSEFMLDGKTSCGADLPDKTCPLCGRKLGKEGHDIPFETFLGFKGDKVPDIDLNFSGEYQAKAHKYAEKIFGREHVFRAGTITTIADRTAYGFVQSYLEKQNLIKRNAEVNRLTKGFTGVKRTTGQHPGGLIVVPKHMDINKFTPLQRPADDQKSGTITTHFDYHALSSRLVKLDILGHDDPTMIKMLEDLTGYDAKNISLDDPRTMSLFSGVDVLGVTPEEIRTRVGTYGIPEFGTKFVRQMLEDTQPKKFSELVRISGFSHGTDVWLNNAQDLIKSGIAKLSEAISTRDDIMLYLIYRGMAPELAFKIMEDVRKGKGLRTEWEKAMGDHDIPSWYISSCKRIKYMFPKAHAVAYVTMAFRIAYYKVNYPQAFYASFFTVRAGEFDQELIGRGQEEVRRALEEIERKGNEATPKEKSMMTVLEVALEMYARGIMLLPVDLRNSDAVCFQIVDGGLLPPFIALQGVGKTAAQNLVAARRDMYFTSVEDLKLRGKISKNVVQILEEHGCLQGLDETDQLSLF